MTTLKRCTIKERQEKVTGAHNWRMKKKSKSWLEYYFFSHHIEKFSMMLAISRNFCGEKQLIRIHDEKLISGTKKLNFIVKQTTSIKHRMKRRTKAEKFWYFNMVKCTFFQNIKPRANATSNFSLEVCCAPSWPDDVKNNLWLKIWTGGHSEDYMKPILSRL